MAAPANNADVRSHAARLGQDRVDWKRVDNTRGTIRHRFLNAREALRDIRLVAGEHLLEHCQHRFTGRQASAKTPPLHR
jgi:hypothetical protein